jgi:1,4-dihydroxy-2-naphthoate octaprenyltransferase
MRKKPGFPGLFLRTRLGMDARPGLSSKKEREEGSMPPSEPTLTALANPVLRYFVATRPPFLSVTLFACLIGIGTASHDSVSLSAATALATLLFALVAHAGINVFNDYYDELNGTDRRNTDRVFPFTGGSRFIQNGVLTAAETFAYAASLFGIVVAAGLWLALVTGPGLIAIGAAGLFVGWAYSAPPFALNSRGLGEPCVAVGFALIVIGADFVQRREFSGLPLIATVPYALLVMNILYINQFPDRRADEASGKRHWVVMLGAGRARWGYALIGLAAYAWLVAAVAWGPLPAWCLAGLAGTPLTGMAAAQLLKFAEQPSRLAPALVMTIAAASAHGLLFAGALFLSPAN